MGKMTEGKDRKRDGGLGVPQVQLPVFYNKGGRKVKANGTRLSPEGCVIYTKIPHTCGTSFSLRITNPHSDQSIQVDSSVIMRKRFDAANRWSMKVRFLNLNEGERDEIRQILDDARAVARSATESKYLKTPVGQAILRYFSIKKLIG
jgi:hypothetical protein